MYQRYDKLSADIHFIFHFFNDWPQRHQSGYINNHSTYYNPTNRLQNQNNINHNVSLGLMKSIKALTLSEAADDL
jgi:hypothetical protein